MHLTHDMLNKKKPDTKACTRVGSHIHKEQEKPTGGKSQNTGYF